MKLNRGKPQAYQPLLGARYAFSMDISLNQNGLTKGRNSGLLKLMKMKYKILKNHSYC